MVSKVGSRSHGQPSGERRRTMISTSRVKPAPAGSLAGPLGSLGRLGSLGGTGSFSVSWRIAFLVRGATVGTKVPVQSRLLRLRFRPQKSTGRGYSGYGENDR